MVFRRRDNGGETSPFGTVSAVCTLSAGCAELAVVVEEVGELFEVARTILWREQSTQFRSDGVHS